MARLIRRVSAVLRLFDTSLDSHTVKREDTFMVVPQGGEIEVHQYLESSEVSGVWLMRYRICPRCVERLHLERLIQLRSVSSEGETFVLSGKGRERLGVP